MGGHGAASDEPPSDLIQSALNSTVPIPPCGVAVPQSGCQMIDNAVEIKIFTKNEK